MKRKLHVRFLGEGVGSNTAFLPDQLVDLLVARFSKEQLLAMSDTERVAAVRALVHEML